MIFYSICLRRVRDLKNINSINRHYWFPQQWGTVFHEVQPLTPIQQNAEKTLDISFKAKLKLSKVKNMIKTNGKHFKSLMQNKSTIGAFATHPPRDDHIKKLFMREKEVWICMRIWYSFCTPPKIIVHRNHLMDHPFVML